MNFIEIKGLIIEFHTVAWCMHLQVYLLQGHEFGAYITSCNFRYSTYIICENSGIPMLKPVDTYALGKQSDQ